MHIVTMYGDAVETFYRVHWADCPEFSAVNAWSAPWGAQRSPDGSQTACTWCDGSGRYEDAGCRRCDRSGWMDAIPGYSCTRTADELAAYFAGPSRGAPADDEIVIVFEGRQTDTGLDGEPTAVPVRIVESLTWAQFTGRRQNQAAPFMSPLGMKSGRSERCGAGA